MECIATMDVSVEVQLIVDVNQGKVRGRLSEESERIVIERSSSGPSGQHVTRCETPFSDFQNSLPKAVAGVLHTFRKEYGSVDFSVDVDFLGGTLLSLSGKDVEEMLKQADLDVDTDAETMECPECGRSCSAFLTVCPDCGNNLHQEEDPNE